VIRRVDWSTNRSDDQVDLVEERSNQLKDIKILYKTRLLFIR
jgi:hypothetical protein